ncbi:efflux transporter outer membrane subunit [Paraburkholderia ferrariae]|uniref:efflux transporter outer membrane subunit n=1 Tax=Paraburkholderia ferrariae TaxID=386056 RepID=UPI000693DED7|nr:efflux transporter outer membrane subunit [Paraburkholderia ferrariae]
MNANSRTIMNRPKRFPFPHRQSALLILGACALLAGCAVGPDYRAPHPDVPAQWSAQSLRTTDAQPDLHQWWRRLNDPLLDELVDEATRGNLDVATATARIREARATVREAGGALYPSLNGSGSLTRAGAGPNAIAGPSPSMPGALPSGSPGSPVNLFQAGFDASWEIDLFGANRRALEAARGGLDAAQWDLRSTQLSLIGDVTTRYVEARGYQARLALARATADSQQETARLTRVRYEAGANSGLDAANASGEAQATLASIPALEAAYAQTVYSLSVLTGQTPGALVARMQQAHDVPAPPLPVAMGVPADVLLARPDVRAAERRYAQSTAHVGVAQAARYPRVTLTGALGTSGTQFGDLAHHSSIGWSIGPSVTIPLFDGGRLKAAVEIADAQRDQSFVAYRAAVLTALQDVENASVALARETESVQSLQRSADAYGQAASMAKSLYRSGSTGFLELLVADRAQFAAQDALIQSRVRVTTDYIALNKALGGGWDGAPQI